MSTGMDAGVGLSVSVHVRKATSIETTLYADEDRATVTLGEKFGVRVTLFLDSADVRRLRNVLAEAAAELDTAAGAIAS